MSGVPKTPTMTARVVRAPTTPQIGDRQPRVLPTARTMVKASTHSTTLARKAGSADHERTDLHSFSGVTPGQHGQNNVTAVHSEPSTPACSHLAPRSRVAVYGRCCPKTAGNTTWPARIARAQ